MKKIIVLLILLSFENLFSQDLKCLNYEFYNSDSDVIEIRKLTDSISGITKLELKTDSLKLYVEKKSILKFPKWSSYNRKGIDSGFKVILRNNSSNDLSLLNMDGRIIIRRQVYYKNKWRNLKSYKKTTRMICGNSYFTKRIIKSRDYLTFVAPCVKGNIKAKFRFIIGSNSKNENIGIYSNESEGFINENLIEI